MSVHRAHVLHAQSTQHIIGKDTGLHPFLHVVIEVIEPGSMGKGLPVKTLEFKIARSHPHLLQQ